MRTVKSFLLALVIVANATALSAQSNIVAATSNHEVSVSTAKYMSTYPNEAYGHVYGKKVLTELLNSEGLKKVFVFNGLEGNRDIKLIFKAADGNGSLLDVSPYDNGYPCPPVCASGGGEEDPKIASIGQAINEGTAQQWILNFQRTYRSRAKAQIFEKESFEQVLAQKGAQGIYFANAITEKGDQTMVLAGVDGYGNIMWDGVVINNGTAIPAFRTLNYPAQNIVAKK